ncbi:MAG: endonuclease/exonuclease/phosphatase family protein [Anaerolineae bacterium]|nr:endonuclease/exonuclease/phosphatase family protein [Anaerolineae bacterium]
MATSSARKDLLRRFVVVISSVLASLHVGLIVAYFCARWLFGNSLWLVDAAAYVLPWLFAPSFLLLPAALICRSRLLTCGAAAPLAIFLAVYGHLYLLRWPLRTAGPAFTVLTYNVLYTNEDVDAVAVEIERLTPDFFGLRELEPSMAEALDARFAERYPHRRVEPGCGFWSRYPVLSYEAFHLVEGQGTWAQQLVLDVDGREVAVLSVHPRSPPVYDIPLTELPAVLPTAFPNRERDADLRGLLLRLEGIAGPLVVIGDFNATDQQGAYALLTRRLRDAHRESGWGMGFTFSDWPGVGPALWRIDYVFYTPDLVALSAGVGDYGGSDHRPVIARLAFRAEQ